MNLIIYRIQYVSLLQSFNIYHSGKRRQMVRELSALFQVLRQKKLDFKIIQGGGNYLDSAIQYNTIQYNTIQYNTLQYNTIQYNTIQYNTIQYNTIQYNT